ncbi:MAG TPA: DUF3696 domain-containing protein [Candidatus Binatia bacterium]
MLTRLRLRNFKAWRDSGDIRFAPLTVLFGTNSAGKTSIPQLLLLLKQTAESADRQRALHLGDARSLVDVGTFEEAVHGRDVEQPLELALDWTLASLLEVRDPLSDRVYAGNQLSFRARIGADERRQPRVESFAYELRRDGLLELDLSLERRREAGGGGSRERPEYELGSPSSRYPLARRRGREGALPAPLRFYGFPDEVAAYFQNATFAADFVLELERLLKSIFYVGPLREYPKRLYLWSGEAPEHVGTRGERAIEAILAASERSFTWKDGQEAKRLPVLVAERLRAMGLIHDFRIEPLGERRNEYDVLVQTSPGLPHVKLTDVGFGVSQILPVIVECFYVPRRSIVLFEQPEVHLHPRVQADLADLFVDAIRARESGARRDCQFVIESHSEHFLRRLQRRIAEQEIAHDDAALYFIHGDVSGARLEELDVDPYGNIRNWPPGFFGDEMADLVARSEAQARRMSEATE